jgi:hypothetical protein
VASGFLLASILLQQTSIKILQDASQVVEVETGVVLEEFTEVVLVVANFLRTNSRRSMQQFYRRIDCHKLYNQRMGSD